MTTTLHFKPPIAKRRLQIINDAIPGIILLFSGLETFSQHGFVRNFMPYISVVVGVAVVRSALGEFRKDRRHRKVNWFDIFGGCVVLLDAADRYNTHKGFQPAHLLFLAGIIIVLRGLFEEKFPKMRRVVLSEETIFVRTSPFHSWELPWSSILRIERSPRALSFTIRNGNKPLNLRRAENREEIMDVIAETARGRGIETSRID